MASAARDAAAILIDLEVITLLLFAPENAKRPLSAPKDVTQETRSSAAITARQRNAR